MYEAHYQLKTKPFTLLPDPEFLYLGTKHKMALSLLEYGLANESAFIVMAGEPGTGKTTLLNRLLGETRHPWTIGVLSNTHIGFGGLLPWIAASFGLQLKDKSEADAFHEFARFLERERSAGRRVLLVVDEAQNIGATMLEELRLLSNLNDGRRRSLQILLSGQLGLRDLLKGPDMVQFAQRVGVEYTLESFSEDETVAYIDHRLQVAGRPSRLFSTLAGRIVFRLTGGTPRLINQLSDHALVYGYAEQTGTITGQVVLAAATARAKHGVFPFVASPDDVNVSEQELAAERLEINTFTETRVQVEGPACHSMQARVAETIEVQDPSSVYREGLELKESGEYKKAIICFDRLATQDSWAVKALAQKGLCLKAVGRYEEALGAMKEASTHDSATEDESRAVRYLWARTLESQKRYDEAREVYVVLNQGHARYRDVPARLARLRRSDPDTGHESTRQVTGLTAFWRGCEQLLRGSQR